jgi:hypothetical protein
LHIHDNHTKHHVLCTRFAAASLHLDIRLDLLYKIPRAVANTKPELAFGDSPNLSFDIPNRQIFLALNISFRLRIKASMAHQAELDRLALSSFEVWLFISPQMSRRLFNLGFGI